MKALLPDGSKSRQPRTHEILGSFVERLVQRMSTNGVEQQ